jgi:hypothetical protein
MLLTIARMANHRHQRTGFVKEWRYYINSWCFIGKPSRHNERPIIDVILSMDINK